jgi:uncharacterized protein (DUF983 family)
MSGVKAYVWIDASRPIQKLLMSPAAVLDFDLLRGLRGRCPCCGRGRLFRAFLKVGDQCAECGEELHHHRADDFPAYCVIFIVGHVVVPLVLAVETAFAPSYWVHLALWLPLTLGMTLGLLQPVKGFIVALQWRMGMHGFEDARKARAARSCTIATPAGRARPAG